MPVNSVICYPATGQVIEREEDGSVLVGGYALPANDDGPVTRVEVSSDMGKTWNDAEITCEPTLWSWAIWKYKIPKEQADKLDKGSRIWCRATDKGGNVQPEKCNWNWRGVAYNAYGEIKNFVIEPHGGIHEALKTLNLDAVRDPAPTEAEVS
jgi:sulfite oxidase